MIISDYDERNNPGPSTFADQFEIEVEFSLFPTRSSAKNHRVYIFYVYFFMEELENTRTFILETPFLSN